MPGLNAYTDPAGPYAFATYDHWYGKDGDDSTLEPADVLLANLLSLRLGWLAVVPLFAAGEGPAKSLRSALTTALHELQNVENFEHYDSVDALEDAI